MLHGDDLGLSILLDCHNLLYKHLLSGDSYKEIAIAPKPTLYLILLDAPHENYSVKNPKVFIDSKGSKYS